MRIYRIASKEHIKDFSGTGAMLYGGRWNAKGYRMLYTSESLSLAMLEIMANLSSDQINKGFYSAVLDMPDELPIQTLTTLPKHWNAYPYTLATIEIGNLLIKENGFCLKVPSTIIPTEYNYLLNPMHDDFEKVRLIETNPILFDQRLLH